MKLKKMILEELLADVDHAEGKKLMPKPPAIAVEIDAVKPEPSLGKKMDALAEGSPEEEKAEGPEVEKAELLAGKPDGDEMSEEDLKKLLAEYMG